MGVSAANLLLEETVDMEAVMTVAMIVEIWNWRKL